jgi:hypothetical protein
LSVIEPKTQAPTRNTETILARISPALLRKLDQRIDGLRIATRSQAVRIAVADWIERDGSAAS